MIFEPNFSVPYIPNLTDCWLEVSTHLEDPESSCLHTDLIGFLLSSSKFCDGSQFLSCYCMLLM
jgi:hypothetical protein